MTTSLQGLTILIADDSPTVLAAARDALSASGARLETVTSGLAAVRAAIDTRPDAIVLDIGMDGINGYHACRLLRLEPATSNTPILLLTGREPSEARFWGMRAGADLCLLKDDGLSQLEPAIRTAVERRRAMALPDQIGRDTASAPATSEADLFNRLVELLDRELLKATILNDVGALAEQMDDLPATLGRLGEVLRRVIDAPFAALVLDSPPGMYALTRPDLTPQDLWQRVWAGAANPAWAPAYDDGRQIVVPRVSEAVEVEGLTPRSIQAAPHWELVYFLSEGRQITAESAELIRLLAQAAALVVSNARLHAEAQRFALTDELTGIYNRRYFQGRLEVELERSARTGGALGLVLVDLDGFKSVNDLHGHLFGDAVLREVSLALSRTVRPYDLLGRFGGEEFSILVPDTPLDGAVSLAERARATVEALRVGDSDVRVTASVGVTAARGGAPDVDGLFQRVEQAAARARATGGNRVEAWRES